jgi:phospholipid-binding lipoprotein MlaA
MARARGRLRWAVAGALPLLLGACAALPRDTSLPVNDPHEAVNRQVMAANLEALRPASEFVKTTIPGPVHDRLHDLNANLKEPRIFVNNVLQGRFEAAAKTTTRLVFNSIFGLGGLVDVATLSGLPQQSGDFGQTMFVWGMPEGPYVVRPYLGPATLRDAVGSTVDMVSNPFGWLVAPTMAMTVGSQGVDVVDRLGQLKMAEDASIDFYSFVRSSYYQVRRNELREALGQPPVVDSPALDDPDAEPAVAAAPTPGGAESASKLAPTQSASKPAPTHSASKPAPTGSASKEGKLRSAAAPNANAPGAAVSQPAAEPPAPALGPSAQLSR